MSRIDGVGGYAYLSQLRQAQVMNNLGNGLFGKINTNGNVSGNQDELTAFESSMLAQFQTAQSNSTSGSVSAFLSLLQNLGQTGATDGTTTTTNVPASSDSTVDDVFAGIGANGDGSISQNELTPFQSTLAAQIENGAAGSDSEVDQANSASTLSAFVQQALEKYMQLTPAGQAMAAAGRFLGIA